MASPESNQPQPPWLPLETKDCSQGLCSPYCPQWCYLVFPPPPPFSFDEEVDGPSGGPTFSPLVIAIIGILASAFLLVSYYTIISKFCGASFRRSRQRRAPPGPEDVESDNEDVDRQSRRHDQEWHIPPTVGLEEALIEKIAVSRYRRGDGLVGCTDCSVCLGEFREDESLRLLPKCSHAFHVRCIDTWLRSHSNCPLCRANIVLVSPAPPQLPAPPPPAPETSREETAVAVGGSVDDEGTSLERGGGDDSTKFSESRGENSDIAVEVTRADEEGRGMRRSFSMSSFHRSPVPVADILLQVVNMGNDHVDDDDAADHESLVGGSSSRRRQSEGEHREGSALHCGSPIPISIPMKRSVSSGRFCLSKQGKGRNSILPI